MYYTLFYWSKPYYFIRRLLWIRSTEDGTGTDIHQHQRSPELKLLWTYPTKNSSMGTIVVVSMLLFLFRNKGLSNNNPLFSNPYSNIHACSKCLFLDIKPLLCCTQKILQRFFAVDAHSVRQHHQPPDAFADFVLQARLIRRFNIL